MVFLDSFSLLIFQSVNIGTRPVADSPFYLNRDVPVIPREFLAMLAPSSMFLCSIVCKDHTGMD